MKTPIRLLLVEDCPDDADLIVRELQRAGYAPSWQRVDTAASLEQALASNEWDVITCDYVMPGFSAIAAVEIIRRRDSVIPTIIVSGEVGEDVAVAVMKAGAQDFVSKYRLARLAPAIQRELVEAEERRSHRRAEAAFRESERRYREVVEQLRDLVWSVDDTGRITFFSQAASRIVGYEPEELLGRKLFDVMPPSEAVKNLDLFQRVKDGSGGVEEEVRLQHKDGTVILVRTNAMPLRDEAGNFTGITGIAVDVTERRAAERALEESQSRLRAILDSAQQSFILLDRDGRIAEFNSNAVKFSKILAGDASLQRGRALLDFVPERARENFSGHFAEALTGKTVTSEGSIHGHSNEEYFFDGRFTPVHDGGGSVSGVCVSALDVTEQKRTEADRARLAAALEQAAEAVVITDAHGTIVYVNAACERMTGFDRKDLHGRPSVTLHAASSTTAEREVIDALDRAGLWRGTLSQRRRDGTVCEMDTIVCAVSDGLGQVIHYVSLAREPRSRRAA